MTSRKLDKIIASIFETEELKNNPPVLIDIGASGNIHASWKAIAPYSICVAFDPDNREMGYIEKENAGYKKLIVINKLVSELQTPIVDFYLTSSPFCSSSLPPDLEHLESYDCYSLFETLEKVSMPSVYLPDVFRQLNI